MACDIEPGHELSSDSQFQPLSGLPSEPADCTDDLTVGADGLTKWYMMEKDDFFTPPATPHHTSDFRTALALQLHLLQSFLIAQHEQDMASLREEKQHLCQRLLARESTDGTTATTPSCALRLEDLQGQACTQDPATGLRDACDGNACITREQKAGATAMKSSDPLAPSVVDMTIAGEETFPENNPDLAETIREQDAVAQQWLNPRGDDADRAEQCLGDAADGSTKFADGTRFSSDDGKSEAAGLNLKNRLANGQPDCPQAEKDERQTLAVAVPRLHRRMSSEHHELTKRLYVNEEEAPNRTESTVSRSLGKSSDTSNFRMGMSDEEYDKLPRLKKYVFSHHMELTSGSVIVANSLVFAFKLQHDGFDCRAAIRDGFQPAKDTWPGGDIIFTVIELVFTCMFVTELLVRFYAYGLRRSIRNSWMYFDSAVISLGLLDVLGAGALGINTSALRLFRLVRLVRILKIFQSLSMFDSLFLLLKAISASTKAAAFSFGILLIIQFVTGMFMCQVLQPFILDDANDDAVREDVFKFFGTFSRTMLTMFEVSMANWVPVCRLLSEHLNQWWSVFFIFYRCMFCFAILKVISAVFITETNRVLASDDELTLMKAKREKLVYCRKLEKYFNSIDTDGDGYLSWQELQALLVHEELAQYLVTLGIDPHDFEKLFWLIDEGDGKISIQTFIRKVSKLKGQSKTIDTLTLLKLTHRIELKLQLAFEKAGLLKADSGITKQEEEEALKDLTGGLEDEPDLIPK